MLLLKGEKGIKSKSPRFPVWGNGGITRGWNSEKELV